MSEWTLQQHNVRYNLYCFPQIIREFIYAALRSWVVYACDDSPLERPSALGRRAAEIAKNLNFLTSKGSSFKQIASNLCTISSHLNSKWMDPQHARYMDQLCDEEYWQTHERSETESTFRNVTSYVSLQIAKGECVFGEELAWLRSLCENLYDLEEDCLSQLHPFLKKYYHAGRLLSFMRYESLSFIEREGTLDCYTTIAHSFTHELGCFRKIYPTVDWELVIDADRLTDSLEKHWKLANFEKLFRRVLENPSNPEANACAERGRLAYELLLDNHTSIEKSKNSFNEIMAVLRTQPNPDLDYKDCHSVQSLKNVAEAYAEITDLPALPEREGGRPRKPLDPKKTL